MLCCFLNETIRCGMLQCPFYFIGIFICISDHCVYCLHLDYFVCAYGSAAGPSCPKIPFDGETDWQQNKIFRHLRNRHAFASVSVITTTIMSHYAALYTLRTSCFNVPVRMIISSLLQWLLVHCWKCCSAWSVAIIMSLILCVYVLLCFTNNLIVLPLGRWITVTSSVSIWYMYV